ncbi:MAG: stage V sporulation protein AD, partial [Selenomonadales bacterium]|nr:stage V sporulation protein AD [Selenomonadales bacterium]
MRRRIGEQTLLFTNEPVILHTGAVAGKKEGDGKLGGYYDVVLKDNLNGCATWEQCESSMMEQAIRTALLKSGKEAEELECVLAGDLLNQLMSTHFAMRALARPFLGLYGACSTMAESLLIGSMMVDGGYCETVACCASSHHEAAERQYRFPTELGVQRPPIAQWTVTGAGCAIVGKAVYGPRVTTGTIGRVVDYGIKDTNALGAAMAPAAVDTLRRHFADTGRSPAYYDKIYSGDLGAVGREIVLRMTREDGIELDGVYDDCGCMIFLEDQDAHAGASGCASSAIVFCGYLFKQMIEQKLRKILLLGTGSLHSPTSYQQKESIPCISHAVSIE